MNKILFHSLTYLLIILLLVPTSAVTKSDYDRKEKGTTFDTIFNRLFKQEVNSGGLSEYIDTKKAIKTGMTQGLGIVSLLKIYDLYKTQGFKDMSALLSDFIFTNLNDPRYPLIANYYDADNEIISNYRNVVDNFLIAWGVKMLSNRINPENELKHKIHNDRSESISKDLSQFERSIGFIDKIRVDQGTSDPGFKIYPNLMTAFIISEANIDLFDPFESQVGKIYDFIKANATNSQGGVYNLYFNGFTDNIITLRNSALFANIALNLYQKTDNQQYLQQANKTMSYIQEEFYDIAVTGGYFETIDDETTTPVQTSKSLFSHALLLQLFMGMANLGDEEARLNLLALWRTISSYFRVVEDEDIQPYFYSTIKRDGSIATDLISMTDNMMLMYSMTQIPLLTNVAYYSEVKFSDQVEFNLTVQVPKNFNSKITLSFDDDIVADKQISGSNNLQEIIMKINPPRPEDERKTVDFLIKISTESIDTDLVVGNFEVVLEPGVDLSIEIIVIFAIVGILVYFFFFRKLRDDLQQADMQIKQTPTEDEGQDTST